MSLSRTITVRNTIGGTLRDLTSCVLRDPTGLFGVIDVADYNENATVLVAAGTPFVQDGTGLYSYTVSGLSAGILYQAYIETVYQGQTERNPLTWRQDDADIASYVLLSEADAIAAQLPGLNKYKNADGDARTAGLIQATIDIDAAGPYQGRKYDLWTPQVLEFPRVPYQSSNQVIGYGTLGAWLGSGQIGVQVWDWDTANNVAVVPDAVKRACVVQADSILSGQWQKALDAMAMGVASKSAGSVSVSYRDPAALLAFIAPMGSLCRSAAQLLRKYQLKQGRML